MLIVAVFWSSCVWLSALNLKITFQVYFKRTTCNVLLNNTLTECIELFFCFFYACSAVNTPATTSRPVTRRSKSYGRSCVEAPSYFWQTPGHLTVLKIPTTREAAKSQIITVRDYENDSKCCRIWHRVAMSDKYLFSFYRIRLTLSILLFWWKMSGSCPTLLLCIASDMQSWNHIPSISQPSS